MNNTELFAAIGGHDYEGESFNSMRVLTSYESACDYARDLIDKGYDYAYVSLLREDGTLNLKNATRIACDGPEEFDLEW